MFSILNSEPLDIWNDQKITENGNLDCDSGNFGDGVKDDNIIDDDKNCFFLQWQGGVNLCDEKTPHQESVT